MKRLTIPLFVALLAVAALTTTLPAHSYGRSDDVTKYTCEMDFPDGTAGVAVVKVIINGGGDIAAAPTVMVTVDYYSSDGTSLGRYEDWSNSSDFPTDENAAEEYALQHFHDRW